MSGLIILLALLGIGVAIFGDDIARWWRGHE